MNQLPICFSLYRPKEFSVQLERMDKKVSQAYAILSFNNIILLLMY